MDRAGGGETISVVLSVDALAEHGIDRSYRSAGRTGTLSHRLFAMA
jgi:hypothetical protein